MQLIEEIDGEQGEDDTFDQMMSESKDCVQMQEIS